MRSGWRSSELYAFSSPLRPSAQNAKALAEELASELEGMGRKVELADEDEEEVSELKAMLERGGCVFRAGDVT